MSTKNLYLILGNGFTIDLVSHLRTKNSIACDIDASNFFKYGAEVPWVGNDEPGFLSSKNCPNLWNLGARPNMDIAKTMQIIEDIITCINVYASHPKKSSLANSKQNDIYFYAYLELVEYIRSLFTFYNNKINEIPDDIHDWVWVKYLNNVINKYDKINIITYNYDVWLERILKKCNIAFNIAGFENEQKITIYKPHGSISFQHQTITPKDAYSIKQEKEIKDDCLENFKINYDFSEISSITAIIPPASEAGRMQVDGNSWSKKIHELALNTFKNAKANDDCIICGISYWHVDRNEIDNIFVNLDPKINIKMINPNPTPSLTAVLTSMFENFVMYPTSNILERLIK